MNTWKRFRVVVSRNDLVRCGDQGGSIVHRLMTAVRQAADRGTAVILVEQFARLALDIADRAYVLVNGRVGDEGTADELRANIAELESKYRGVD